MTEAFEEPELVIRARTRAGELGFTISSAPGVGGLLAVLAAAVPPNGRIIELGTGSGVGVAWLVHGLGARTDVTVTSVDTDARLLDTVRDDAWPTFVDDGLVDAIGRVRQHLMSDESLLAVDMAWSTGIILATKRAS